PHTHPARPSFPTRRSSDLMPTPDIIVVPGGPGSRALLEHRDLIEWVRSAHETSQWTTSVCTGSLFLGAAGLLNGLRATTHWLELDRKSTRLNSSHLPISHP